MIIHRLSPHRLKGFTVLLVALLLVGAAALAGGFYARPPYDIAIFWPSTDWRLSAYASDEILSIGLVKGTGTEEQAGLFVQGFPLGDIEGDDALIMFHWMMEEDFSSTKDAFERQTPLAECRISSVEGYREEMRFEMEGLKFRGSIVSFRQAEIFYQVVFMAMPDHHESARRDFERILEQAQFLESPHPLFAFIPEEILGITMPIVEAIWPSAEGSGLSLLVPKAVAYGADPSHTVLLVVEEAADASRAQARASSLLTKKTEEVAESLGSIDWVSSEMLLHHVPMECREAVAGDESYYVGLIAWAFTNRVYALRIFGPASDYCHESLMDAVESIMSTAVR